MIFHISIKISQSFSILGCVYWTNFFNDNIFKPSLAYFYLEPQLENYGLRVIINLSILRNDSRKSYNYVVVYNNDQTRYVATQICYKIQKDKLVQTLSFKVGKHTLSELFAYLLSVSFLLDSLVIFVGLFVFSIDPI